MNPNTATEGLRFKTPEEELAYLRAKVLEKEERFAEAGVERPREAVARESIQHFKSEATPHLDPAKLKEAQTQADQMMAEHKETELGEMVKLSQEKGVLHVLQVVEKMKGWRFEDDLHNHLVNQVLQGLPVRGVKEKGPLYKAVHMTLFEIVLPKSEQGKERPLSDLLAKMEQLYAGLLSLSDGKKEQNYLTFEVANPEGEEDTHIFASVPNTKKELFTSQILGLFPKAQLVERTHDYNVFSEFGVSVGAVAELSALPAYPLKTYEQFGDDPLNVILNSFSKIPSAGAGAALQIVFKPAGDKYAQRYSHALGKIKKGTKPREALRNESLSKEVARAFGQVLFSSADKKDKEEKPQDIDNKAVESITKKLESPIAEVNIRLVATAQTEEAASKMMSSFQSAFNQYENPGVQALRWREVKTTGWKTQEGEFYRSFIFRLFRIGEALPLNLREISSFLHFHTEALHTGSTLKRLTSRGAPTPISMGGQITGTPIGVSRYQGSEKPVSISADDRLRHFYTIGQTGTGKSTLLKNMAIHDIRTGEGVCVIDPHGSDIQDILASVPPERIDDVIYFDPADTERPMGLNMLEYDHTKPEQKTFVVNELFSIFQKLYGGVPESMGPMFEQYFRNAAMLVIEDPDSGSTLLDVSRVLSNKEYRALKLSRCKNPIVVQFWTEVAEKAGGEASLANIVPYITSKFDVFLANDIMRPIVAAEHSAFNLREVMDSRKILLVNLSKGRLGDINANLIGLIIVGKILLAALSRVDAVGKDLSPFYLYIDEFQNVTTNSIATILSEARKYKLSLSIAHQFIAQLEEKIRDAVFGNVGSICAFRVGADDAKYLESQFAPAFSADDLMNIDNRRAHLKMLVNGRPVEPFDVDVNAPLDAHDEAVARQIVELSRERYGRSRAEAEAEVSAKYQKTVPSS